MTLNENSQHNIRTFRVKFVLIILIISKQTIESCWRNSRIHRFLWKFRFKNVNHDSWLNWLKGLILYYYLVLINTFLLIMLWKKLLLSIVSINMFNSWRREYLPFWLRNRTTRIYLFSLNTSKGESKGNIEYFKVLPCLATFLICNCLLKDSSFQKNSLRSFFESYRHTFLSDKKRKKEIEIRRPTKLN